MNINGQSIKDGKRIANTVSIHFATAATTVKSKVICLKYFIWGPFDNTALCCFSRFLFFNVTEVQVITNLKIINGIGLTI